MDIEIDLFWAIHGLAHKIWWLDSLMQLISHSSFWILVGTVVFVVGMRLKDARLLSALVIALMALGASDLISFEIIKPLVARERPCWLLPDVQVFDGHCGGSYGFTSNHAANGFAVWLIIVKVYGLLSRPAQVVLTGATAVAISRVYLGVHFVGDVVGGALLGAVVASALWVLGLRALQAFIEAKLKLRW